MEFVKHQENFTIVILKESKTPGYLQASWMHDMGIINEEEWSSLKNVVLGLSLSQFSIGDNMQVLCNNERIQIGTNDITKIQRLISICQGIIECYDIGHEKFVAVGINTDFSFSFLSKEESIKFGNHFVPFQNWKLLTDSPRVMEFAVTDEAVSSVNTPRKSIKFSSVSSVNMKDGTQIPIINANANYHFEVKDRDGVRIVLGKAEGYYIEYIEFINNFLKELKLD